MKRNKYDKIFSDIIRTRDKWCCKRCGKNYYFNKGALQNSHYFGRTRYSVRFDEDNCDALCYGCHGFWEKENREEYRNYMIKKIGSEKFELLTYKAQSLSKKREYENDIFYKEMKKRLKELEIEFDCSVIDNL